MFSANEGFNIEVNFTRFELKSGVSCEIGEYVRVYDTYLLGQFCGNLSNMSWTLYSSGHTIMLTFNLNIGSGFQASFTAVRKENRKCLKEDRNYLSVCLSQLIYPMIVPSTHPPTHPSIHPSTLLSVLRYCYYENRSIDLFNIYIKRFINPSSDR